MFGLTILGAALGARWDRADGYIQPIGWLLALGLAAGIAVWVARRWVVVRAEYAALDRERRANA